MNNNNNSLQHNFNNQTVFELSQDLAQGFTVLNNNILTCGLSFNALGLYSTIIQKAYIPGWKVYQSTLINKINKKAAVRNGIQELIEFGLITKEQIRVDGRIKGVKYIITATPTKKKDYDTGEFIDGSESVENTNFPPKAEKRKSVKQISVKWNLLNKETKEIKNIKNKDNTTTTKNNNNTNSTKETDVNKKNSSSSSLDINLNIKKVTRSNIEKLKLNKEQLELLEQYVSISNYNNLDGFAFDIAKKIKTGIITNQSLNIISNHSNTNKPTSNNTTTVKPMENRIQNFKEKDYDYDKLTHELMGWD